MLLFLSFTVFPVLPPSPSLPGLDDCSLTPVFTLVRRDRCRDSHNQSTPKMAGYASLGKYICNSLFPETNTIITWNWCTIIR